MQTHQSNSLDSNTKKGENVTSENRAKLTVYYYDTNPDQWERDLVAFRKERGEYE